MPPNLCTELRLALFSDLVVLTPNIGRDQPRDAVQEPQHDTTLRGTVTLSLQRDINFKKLVVELVRNLVRCGQTFGDSILTESNCLKIGSQEVRIAGVYHKYNVLRKTLRFFEEAVCEMGKHE